MLFQMLLYMGSIMLLCLGAVCQLPQLGHLAGAVNTVQYHSRSIPLNWWPHSAHLKFVIPLNIIVCELSFYFRRQETGVRRQETGVRRQTNGLFFYPDS